MVGFSLPLTFPPLTTIILYHIITEIAIGKLHKFSMNVYSFLCKTTKRPGFGRMWQGWKWLVLLEKIPKGLEEANTFRKNRARKGKKPSTRKPRAKKGGKRGGNKSS